MILMFASCMFYLYKVKVKWLNSDGWLEYIWVRYIFISFSPALLLIIDWLNASSVSLLFKAGSLNHWVLPQSLPLVTTSTSNTNIAL